LLFYLAGFDKLSLTVMIKAGCHPEPVEGLPECIAVFFYKEAR
jgi:hypothetical protein